MPVSRRCPSVRFPMRIFRLMWAIAMAAGPSLGAAGPPLTYRLDQVTVRVTRPPGGSASKTRQVSLFGTGNATLERDGRSLPFRYASKDLVALLNELYRIHFFELPANYTGQYSVFLKDDGTVVTQALRMSDTPGTSVCFAVADYKKCVNYGTEGPRELADLAQRLFAEAERLVKGSLAKP